MKNPSWRRTAARFALVLPLVAAPMGALGWAEATHVYMAKRADKMADRVDANALCNAFYGSVAVDMFSYDFTLSGQTLHAVLHDRTMAVAAVPWEFAATEAERAFAHGLASHNNVWGTDATAHVDGITEGNREGYVITKAGLLAAIPQFRDAVFPLVGNDEETLLLVSHILVEYAMDLVVARVDPAVGGDLMAGAIACPPAPSVELLVDAWVPIFSHWMPPEEAEAKIREDDTKERLWSAQYGFALQQPNAQQLVAGGVAAVAAEFLRVPEEQIPYLTVLIDQALSVGQLLVADDLMAELDATIGRVNSALSIRKIKP